MNLRAYVAGVRERAASSPLALAGASCGFGLLVGLLVFTPATALKPVDAPAWVQALGSVIAIGVAVWTVHSQDQRFESRAWATDAKRLHLTLHLSGQLLDGIRSAIDSTGSVVEGFDASNFDSIRRALEEVALSDAYSGKGAIALINQRRTAQFVQTNIAEWRAKLPKPEELAKATPQALLKFTTALAAFQAQMLRMREAAANCHNALMDEFNVLLTKAPSGVKVEFVTKQVAPVPSVVA